MAANIARRRFLGGISLIALATAPGFAEAANRISTAKAGRPGSGGGGTTLTFNSPTLNGSPYTSDHAPVFREAFVCMSPTVAQNAERIDVQLAFGTPYTPEATTVTVSGANAAWFSVYLNAYLVFNAATRASVPRGGWLPVTVNASNPNGASEQSVAWIWVPNSGQGSLGEVFISQSGSDTTGAGTVGSPYKHCPGTLDWTGGAITYTQGQTMLFDGSAKHPTALRSAGWPNYDGPPHTGTLANPFRYAFMGWNGQAKLTGVVNENGTPTASTTAECFSSPAIANLTTVVVGTAIERYQPWFWKSGDVMGWLAQYPRPTDLTSSAGAQGAADGTNGYNGTTSAGGMKQVFYTTNPADTTPVRLYFNSGGTSYIQDAALDAHFNNASVAFNAAGIGVWMKGWFLGNNVDLLNITGYDVATHQMTFTTSNAIQTSSSYTAYALMGSPYDVQVSTQYAMSYDGLKVIEYAPATPGQRGASRNIVAGGIGTANISFHQMWVEGYSGGGLPRAGASVYAQGGSALRCRPASSIAGVSVYGLEVRYCNNESEDSLGFQVEQNTPSTTQGLDQPMFDRFHFVSCVRGRASQAVGCLLGLQTGSGPGGFPTKAEVLANPRGKVRWWYVETNSVSRTVANYYRMRGMEFRERVTRDFNTVHGDGDAWYPNSTGLFGDHNLCVGDFWDNVLRAHSTDLNTAVFVTGGLNNWYDGIACAGDQVGTNAGWYLFNNGDPGALYSSCIFMQSSRSTGPVAPCMYMQSGLLNMTLQGCVMNGATTSTATISGIPATWTIDQCGLTVPGGFPAHDAVNSRFVTGTIALTTQQTWDGVTIPAAWKPVLRLGAAVGTVKVGPFPDWTV